MTTICCQCFFYLTVNQIVTYTIINFNVYRTWCNNFVDCRHWTKCDHMVWCLFQTKCSREALDVFLKELEDVPEDKCTNSGAANLVTDSVIASIPTSLPPVSIIAVSYFTNDTHIWVPHSKHDLILNHHPPLFRYRANLLRRKWRISQRFLAASNRVFKTSTPFNQHESLFSLQVFPTFHSWHCTKMWCCYSM